MIFLWTVLEQELDNVVHCVEISQYYIYIKLIIMPWMTIFDFIDIYMYYAYRTMSVY